MKRDGMLGVVWLGIGLGVPICKLVGILTWVSWRVAVLPLMAFLVVALAIVIATAFTSDDQEPGI